MQIKFANILWTWLCFKLVILDSHNSAKVHPVTQKIIKVTLQHAQEIQKGVQKCLTYKVFAPLHNLWWMHQSWLMFVIPRNWFKYTNTDTAETCIFFFFLQNYFFKRLSIYHLLFSTHSLGLNQNVLAISFMKRFFKCAIMSNTKTMGV